MGAFAIVFYHLISPLIGNTLSTIITIIACSIVYFISLLIIGGINREDLLMIPFGKKFADFIRLK
jgi:hypothetical protein